MLVGRFLGRCIAFNLVAGLVDLHQPQLCRTVPAHLSNPRAPGKMGPQLGIGHRDEENGLVHHPLRGNVPLVEQHVLQMERQLDQLQPTVFP